MHFSTLVLFSGLAASVLAVPATRHSVHESRFIVPPGWERQGRLEHDLVLPVRVGLTQSNLDNAEDLLADVSDPESTNYGNHWSDERIANFFAPSQHTVSAVRSWLNSSGISSHRISQSAGRGWLDFKATVAEVEQLLKTEYWRYEHDTGMAHLSCHEYSVPEHITKHIDFITPTLHFDAQVPRKLSDHVKRAKIPPKIAPGSGGVSSGTVIKAGGISGGPVIGKSVTPPVNRPGSGFVGGSACGQYVTPACLRALYNIPHGTKNLTSLGIVEYFPQTFLQSDMNNFQRISVTNDVGMPVGTSPLIQNIDGGSVLPLSEMDGSYWAESNLDLQYAMGLVWPQQVTLYQVGDNGTGTSGAISFNNFLDGIDKAYCTANGGDTPGFDKAYPDPTGYNHTADCGVWKPASVISTSYGYNEHDLSPAYERRQCNEYMKLGLKGVSFIFSSGDNGVAGNGGTCIDSTGAYTDGSYGSFNPLFPSTCPYVTAVGATQLQSNNSALAPEVACETVIHSGGGFSNRFAMPKYQKNAVTSYLNNYAPTYASGQYNNSGVSRGFPDVSANGANYIVALAGGFSLVYGTSASAPTFASLIAMINNERIAIGKKPLGFLNNVLYANPKMFNDVTGGSNPGCGTAGFSAQPGWDAVTGLGTPDYNKMLKRLLKVAAA